MNQKYAEILVLLQTTKNMPLAIVAALKSIEDDLAKQIPPPIKGDPGKEGPIGYPGETGGDGPQGPEGKEGPVGPQGPEGPMGAEGPAGKQGPAGSEGKQGATGPRGPQGNIGPEGKQGKQGDKGEDGSDGSPDTGVEIIKKINNAPDATEYKIHASKIIGLSTVIMGMGGGGGGGSGSGSGGSTWGSITGTLSAQTDLQAALDAKVTGSGTINQVPKFTAAGIIGNGRISDNGSQIFFGNAANNMAAPVLSAANDPDTGIDWSGSNVLVLGTNGQKGIRIPNLDNSGNNITINDVGTNQNTIIKAVAGNAITVDGNTGAVTLLVALPIASGGTGQTTAANAFNGLSPITTLGDVIYGSAANVSSRLAGNTTATQKFMTQTGTGAVSAAPAWFDLFGTANTWTGQQYFNSKVQVGLPTSGAVVIGDVTGNTRGLNALDVQGYRSASTQVASGSRSSTLGGGRNTASGTYSNAIGNFNTAVMLNDNAFGYSNTASGSYCSAFGGTNTASGYVSTVSGYNSTASGQYSIALGRGVKSTGNFSVAIGASSALAVYDNVASGLNSIVIGSSCTATQTKSIAIGANVANTVASSVEIGPSNTVKLQFSATGLRPLGSTYLAADGSAGLSVTITTAKLTPATGTNGSMTFKDGILTAQVAAT